MTDRLVYDRAELMADHPYAKPHEEVGYRLHGGFLESGEYTSPRTLVRWPAVRAWSAALEARGWPLIDADTDLLELPNYPTIAQEKVLLSAGLGQGFWNSLTVTGIIEARGGMLCQFPEFDIQRAIVDDITETATGHLNKGLLYAHGADEGGDPAIPGVGAHDAMWFAARDLAFGKDAYPPVDPPANISRPAEDRELPQLPEGIERLVKLLMNVLMIEVRAESFFAFCVSVFRDPANFKDRREGAELAAVMVERIRKDEAIHVAYLRTVISEMRSFTFRTVDGGTIKGDALLDPLWAQMVEWHGKLERELSRERSREEIGKQAVEKLGAAGARDLLARFDAAEGLVAA